MRKCILITGGPVSTRLDAVKIITNRFKGGLMIELANQLSRSFAVTYLTEIGTPTHDLDQGIAVEFHDGLESYREQVLRLSPQRDAVILGAAVANISPKNPWKGKFPSHNYGPEDVIPIEFVLTPRIINEVKEVAPSTQLFGFKLLSNVTTDELIAAAYDIVLSARCSTVFANDRLDLKQIHAVTKERGVHRMLRDDIASWITTMLQDEYYRTCCHPEERISSVWTDKMDALISRYSSLFKEVEEGLIFGTVAVRMEGEHFITTARGKKELSDYVKVNNVTHEYKVVYTFGKKATLNAPLLAAIFAQYPEVHAIVHSHVMLSFDAPTYPYAPPGTVRDSMRQFGPDPQSFNIAEHGSFRLLDKDGQVL